MTPILKLISLGLLLLLLHLQPAWAGPSKEAKRILVLHSEEKAHPAHELADQGMRSVFDSNSRFDIHLYDEYLDVSRFPGPANARVMADYLNRKYAGMKIDVIITVYPAAADFLLKLAPGLFPDMPIVANEVTQAYAENLKRSPQARLITGTIVGENASGLLDSIFRVRPGTRQVALVSGTAANDIYGEQVFIQGLEKYQNTLQLIDLAQLSMEETLARVADLPMDTIVLYESISRDGKDQTFVPREALAAISRVSSVPVFGLYDSYLGYGIVGGRLVSWELLGREAAGMVLRILGGESPAFIPFGGQEAYVNAYDWRELKRWNIPEPTVPAGSEIRYRVPSIWEEHSEAIIGAIALIMIESVLIIGLVVNLRRRRLAEGHLRESEARLSLAAESADAGMWSIEADNGRVWATDKTRELLGLPRHIELQYDDFLRRVHPDDCERLNGAIQEAIQSGKDATEQYRIQRADGSLRWLASHGRFQPAGPGQPMRLMGVTVDITDGKQGEELLRQNQQDLSRLAGRIISAQEEELRRLSREIHDDLTQRLAALALDAALIEKQLNPSQSQTVKELKDMRDNLSEVAEEVHDLSRRLHPSILDDLGLVQAVQAESAAFINKTGIDLSITTDGFPDSVSRELALCLYRVIQEGLQNISKHSGAKAASITLQGLSDGVRLLIEDNGVGFDPEEVRNKAGIGLSSMRERVRLLNGAINYKSQLGQGTQIEIFIPIREAA
ncbi:MAG: PAS domain-containing protein [Hyphomicrobiales bacterium]